jgi:hypothetical protein
MPIEDTVSNHYTHGRLARETYGRWRGRVERPAHNRVAVGLRKDPAATSPKEAPR